MSKPTDKFWDRLGWCLIWLGLFGGIAILVYIASASGDQVQQKLCIQQHGIWTQVDPPEGVNYYTCQINTKIK